MDSNGNGSDDDKIIRLSPTNAHGKPIDYRAPFGFDPKTGKPFAPYGLTQSGYPKRSIRRQSPTKIAGKLATIADKLELLGCDPIEILVELATDKGVENPVRFRAAAELASYVYTKVKNGNSFEDEGKPALIQKNVYVIAVPEKNLGNANSAEAWLQSVAPQKIIDAQAAPVTTVDKNVDQGRAKPGSAETPANARYEDLKEED